MDASSHLGMMDVVFNNIGIGNGNEMKMAHLFIAMDEGEIRTTIATSSYF
jgi:hypothetical protein